MISVRTARAVIILCGLTAAIAPIDTGWTQAYCHVQESKTGFLLNGEPATAAQVKQCEQCQSGQKSGSACAAYSGKEALESKREKANEKGTAELKAKAAQKNKTLNSNTMSNTQSAVPVKKK